MSLDNHLQESRTTSRSKPYCMLCLRCTSPRGRRRGIHPEPQHSSRQGRCRPSILGQDYLVQATPSTSISMSRHIWRSTRIQFFTISTFLPRTPPLSSQATMAWTYIFYYNKDSDFDEVAVYRRIKAELQHPFEISVCFTWAVSCCETVLTGPGRRGVIPNAS